MKFVKKPVIVDAIKFIGKQEPILEFIKDSNEIIGFEVDSEGNNIAVIISTLEGEMKANINDWIIKGVSGEIYPCRPDIFSKTYEPVE